METETTSPYPGPRPFTAAESQRFFGRSRELQDLAALVIAQPLTVLYGATGAGKTSLLCAGVVPELERVGFEVLPVARVGGLLPPDVDATRLRNVFTYSVLLHWVGPDDDLGALAQHTLASFLQARLKAGGRKPLALVLDQLGDMFSAYPAQWEQREAFLRELAECLPGDRPGSVVGERSLRPLRVLLAIRDEQLANLERHAALLPDVLRVRYAIEGLRVPEAMEAISGPAPNLFSTSEAEQLARSLAQRRVRLANGKQVLIASDRIEPMHIQLACDERFERGGRAGPLSKPLDPEEALIRFYDLAVARAASGWGGERKLRTWLGERLVTPEGTRSSQLRGKRNVGGLSFKLVENLEAARLIRSEERAGNTWYEVVHDRLAAPIQASNAVWFAAQKKARRAWRFVAFMLVFAGIVVGLTYLGQMGWQHLEGIQGDKKGLEAQLASLTEANAKLSKQLLLGAAELAGEQRRVLLTQLAADTQAVADDVQALQGVVLDMGRYRPNARDVDLEAQTLTNYFASGQALIPLGAQVDALIARQQTLADDIKAFKKAQTDPSLRPLHASLAAAAEALEDPLERAQKAVAALAADHARHNPALSAALDGYEAATRPGAPNSARVRELSRLPWREGFRALLAGDAASAKDRFERSQARDASNPAPVDALARLAWSQGQVESAEQGYRAALALDRDYSPSLAGMAEVYLNRASLADAERCARKALTLQPDYGPAHLAQTAIDRLLAAPDAERGKVSKDNPCTSKKAAASEPVAEPTPEPTPTPVAAEPEPEPAQPEPAAKPEPAPKPVVEPAPTPAKPEPKPKPAAKPKPKAKPAEEVKPLNRDVPDAEVGTP
ncbi:MAG: hypothetical protein IPO88_00130 [Nannocystis sp.]|uniref:nSTAND1 domain-containing NTPase n=1 Tax=Nannocystis sp. TaxID=1962667 RepID=UPI0024227780|nr:hypothetical protein [Nannocystis sp.]MBK9751909.1 hypothetical protein [Nannocystis sp.]